MTQTFRNDSPLRALLLGAGLAIALAGVLAAQAAPAASAAPAAALPLHDPREVHLAEIRQLTFGGENAEAY